MAIFNTNSDARKSAEDYLGRPMTDAEYNALIRATYAESGSWDDEAAMVAGTILNRARNSGKTVTSVLAQKNQFQSVTGTPGNRVPSDGYSQGPPGPIQRRIENSFLNTLPRVSHKQVNFTSANPAAYGKGTNIGFLNSMQEAGGSKVGGSVFNTSLGGGGSTSSGNQAAMIQRARSTTPSLPNLRQNAGEFTPGMRGQGDVLLPKPNLRTNAGDETPGMSGRGLVPMPLPTPRPDRPIGQVPQFGPTSTLQGASYERQPSASAGARLPSFEDFFPPERQPSASAGDNLPSFEDFFPQEPLVAQAPTQPPTQVAQSLPPTQYFRYKESREVPASQDGFDNLIRQAIAGNQLGVNLALAGMAGRAEDPAFKKAATDYFGGLPNGVVRQVQAAYNKNQGLFGNIPPAQQEQIQQAFRSLPPEGIMAKPNLRPPPPLVANAPQAQQGGITQVAEVLPMNPQSKIFPEMPALIDEPGETAGVGNNQGVPSPLDALSGLGGAIGPANIAAVIGALLKGQYPDTPQSSPLGNEFQGMDATGWPAWEGPMPPSSQFQGMDATGWPASQTDYSMRNFGTIAPPQTDYSATNEFGSMRNFGTIAPPQTDFSTTGEFPVGPWPQILPQTPANYSQMSLYRPAIPKPAANMMQTTPQNYNTMSLYRPMRPTAPPPAPKLPSFEDFFQPPQQQQQIMPMLVVPQIAQQPQLSSFAQYSSNPTQQNAQQLAQDFANYYQDPVYEKPDEMGSWGSGWGYDETQFLPDLDAISGHGW